MSVERNHAKTRRRGENLRARSAQEELAGTLALVTSKKNSASPRLRVQIMAGGAL